MPWARRVSVIVALLSWGDLLVGRMPGWPEAVVFTAFAVALFFGAVDLRLQAYARVRWRGGPGAGQVALTFDDGPDPRTTPAVLETLKRYGVPATFFVLGCKVRAAPGVVQQIVAAGHTVGLHGDEHSWRAWVTPKRARQALARAQTALVEAVGVRAAYFRPPYGVSVPGLGVAIADSGLQVVGWSLRTLDTRPVTASAIAARAREIARRVRPGDVILMHDAPERDGESTPAGPALLAPFLEALAERNLRVGKLSEVLDVERGTPAPSAGALKT